MLSERASISIGIYDKFEISGEKMCILSGVRVAKIENFLRRCELNYLLFSNRDSFSFYYWYDKPKLYIKVCEVHSKKKERN